MDYKQKSFNELKQLLKDRELPTTGKKIDLITKLEEYDKKKEADEKRFRVNVKTLMGSYYTIYIESSDTIAELKNKIQKKTGCVPNKQVLYLLCNDKPKMGDMTYPNGQIGKLITDDTETLSSIGTYKDSMFHLHMRLI